jgi:DNA replication protein DnaC
MQLLDGSHETEKERMETEAKAVSKVIPGLLESIRTPRTTTLRPRNANRKWLDKWLGLDTSPHPRLKEFEYEVWRFCADFYKDPAKGRLLFAHGANGNGKSRVYKSIKHWCRSVRGNYFVPEPNVIRGPHSEFWEWPKLLSELKQGNWELVGELCRCELLCLDEIGGGHDPSRVGADVLCQILSSRENRWTYLATNVSPEAWEEYFDRRITSRFFRNSVVIDLHEVPDYRLIKPQ